MAIFTLDDLRKHYGANGQGKSDEQLLQDYAPRVGMDASSLANKLGYDGGSSGSENRERLSASVDNYQSNLYGVAAASARALGLPAAAQWADRQRSDNEFQANVASSRAKDLGAVDSYKDVHGVGDAADYVVGLGIQSLPYAAESLAGGVVARGLMSGTRAALGAAEAAGDTVSAVRAARALERASVVGATVASYPSSVGDILSNQRDQNGGENLGAALVGGVPYSLLNAGLGVEHQLAKGALSRNTARALDDMGGVRGVAARTAASAGKTALEEGASELGQEFVNQYAGRMAVDPNETFVNPKSVERFAESAVGGAALGGLFGGAGGGWRRSEHAAEISRPVNDTPGESTDLLQGDSGAPPQYNLVTEPAPLQQRIDQNLGVGLRVTPDNYAQQFTDAANEPTGQRVSVAPNQTEQELDAGDMTAIQSGELAQQEANRRAQEEHAARRARAQNALVDIDPTTGQPAIKLPPQTIQLYHDLVTLKDAGKLGGETFTGMVGAIREALPLDDKKAINAVRKEVEAIKNPKPIAGAANAQPNVPAPADVATGAGVAGSTQPGGSVGAVGQLAADATGAPAGVAAAPAPSVEPAQSVESGPVASAGAVAAPAPTAAPAPPVEKPKGMRKAPKPGEAPVKRGVAPPVAGALPKFDNEADLADAVAKENGLSPEYARAYMDSEIMGRSLSKIAADLGKGKSTAGDMVKKMRELMKPAKSTRLEAGAETVASPDEQHAAELEAHAAPEVEHEEDAVNPHEVQVEGEDHGVSYHGDDAIRVDDEGTVDVSGDPKQTGISVRGGMDAGGEVKANNDAAAERAYKAALKDEKSAKALWDVENSKEHKDHQVKWEHLGPAQRAGFADEAKKGNAKQAYESISTMANEGLKFHRAVASTLGKTVADSPKDAVKAVGEARKFPAVANAVAERVNVEGTSLALRPLSVGKGAEVAAAVVNLANHEEAGPFFRHALENTSSVVTFKAPPFSDMAATDGSFDTNSGQVMVNAEGVVIGGAYANDSQVATDSVLAHELVHAADRGAARHYSVEQELLSDAPGSKTAVSLNVTPEGEVVVRAGSVMDEAATFVSENEQSDDPVVQLLRHRLRYPTDLILGELKDLADTPVDARAALAEARAEKISDAEEHAATEIGPVLAQLYLEVPGMLQEQLPLGYAHAKAILSVTSHEQFAKVVLEKDAYERLENHQNADAGATGRSEAAPGIRGQVRPSASSADALRAGRADAEGSGVRGNREARPGTQASQSPGLESRLTRGAADAGAGSASGLDRASGNPVLRAVRGRPESPRHGDDGLEPRNIRVAPGGVGSSGGLSTSAQNGLAAIPPPDLHGNVKGWFSSIMQDKWRAHPSLLGFLTTEQLADRFKDIPMVKAFSDTMQRMAGRASHLATVSDGIKTQWENLNRKLGPKAATAFNQVLHDATDTQIWPDVPLDDPKNKHLDRKNADIVAAHAKLSAAYKALPEGYRTLFHTVLGDLQSQYAATVAGYRKGIVEAAYAPAGAKGAPTKEQIDAAASLKKDERAAFLEANDTSALARNTYRALWRDLDEHSQQFPAKLAGPYFPKIRFGDHVVAYKSPELHAAEGALVQARERLDEMLGADLNAPIAALEAQIDAKTAGLARMTDKENKKLRRQEIADLKKMLEIEQGPLTAQREVVSEAQKRLTELKKDEAHYGVEFYETLGAAKRREAQLKAHFGDKGPTVERSLRDQYLNALDGVTPAFMRKLENRLTGELTGADAAKVRNTVRELYLQMQPENNASKSRLRRIGVAGAKNAETLRAYATASLRNAFNVSRLEYRDQLNQALNDLRFTRKDDDAKLVGQELAKRMVQNSTYQPNKLLSMASNATYLTYLGASPAFLVTQLTQPWVISAPIMAGRHGFGAIKLLGAATKDAAKLLKVSFDKNRTMRFAVDTAAGAKAGLLTPDEAAMLKDMFDRGRIDITITHDLGAAASGEESNWLSKAADMSGWPAHQAEVLNRIATALAAYRAETAAGARGRLDATVAHDRALKYADQIVSETHLNYSAENRARLMHPNSWGGWGRIMFQFRAYQQGMLYLIYKNLADGLRGDKEALRSVGYLAGMQLATAGLAGMPLPGVAAVIATLLYKAWEDDDDEHDLKEMLFQGLKSVGGETFATAVTKGLPAAAGVDVSGRMGLGSIASVAPYADDRKEGRDMVAAYWIALTGGPAAGMAANWAEALKAAGQGDFVKATTFAAPKALADIVRAGAYQAKGLTDSRGNNILQPEDIGAASTAIKAFGFQPAEIGRMYDQRSAFFEAKQNRNDARAKLLQDFARARMAGDDVSGVKEQVQGFNERHPDDRITIGNLEQAVVKRRQQERSLRNGVPVGKREKALAESLGVE